MSIERTKITSSSGLNKSTQTREVIGVGKEKQTTHEELIENNVYNT